MRFSRRRGVRDVGEDAQPDRGGRHAVSMAMRSNSRDNGLDSSSKPPAALSAEVLTAEAVQHRRVALPARSAAALAARAWPPGSLHAMCCHLEAACSSVLRCLTALITISAFCADDCKTIRLWASRFGCCACRRRCIGRRLLLLGLEKEARTQMQPDGFVVCCTSR